MKSPNAELSGSLTTARRPRASSSSPRPASILTASRTVTRLTPCVDREFRFARQARSGRQLAHDHAHQFIGDAGRGGYRRLDRGLFFGVVIYDGDPCSFRLRPCCGRGARGTQQDHIYGIRRQGPPAHAAGPTPVIRPPACALSLQTYPIPLIILAARRERCRLNGITGRTA